MLAAFSQPDEAPSMPSAALEPEKKYYGISPGPRTAERLLDPQHGRNEDVDVTGFDLLDRADVHVHQFSQLLLGQFTGQGFNLHDHLGGETGGRPVRGSLSKPAKRSSKNRLRHLLTIWRGTERLAAIWSLGRP